MSEFKEFDQQGSVPNKDTGSIISHAFEMFKGVFLYAFVTMIIYLIADFVLQSITGLNFYSNYSNFNKKIEVRLNLTSIFYYLSSFEMKFKIVVSLNFFN